MQSRYLGNKLLKHEHIERKRWKEREATDRTITKQTCHEANFDVARTVNIALRSAISALMAHQHSLFPLNRAAAPATQCRRRQRVKREVEGRQLV